MWSLPKRINKILSGQKDSVSNANVELEFFPALTETVHTADKDVEE